LTGGWGKAVQRELSRIIARVHWRPRKHRGGGDNHQKMLTESAETIRPIVRSYLSVVGVYYLLNALFYRVTGDLGLVPATAAATGIVCLGLFRFTRGTQSMRRLEIAGHVANLLLFGNTLLDISLDYQSVKLVYFALLLPIFAISGARLRVVIVAALPCVLTLCLLARQHETKQFIDYLWLGITALTAALGMGGAIRVTLLRAVRARMASDHHRDEASTLANFDALTGLPNRRSFFEYLDIAMASGARFDLALVDLDGFKPVNDVYGHAAGDAVLIEVGRRLTDLCRDRGTVARLGGDEFALIVHGLAYEADVAAFGETVRASLMSPIALPSAQATVSGSLGFVRHDGAARAPLNASELLERADYALYQAKANRGTEAVIFDRCHERDMHRLNRVEQALRDGNLDTELHVLFQPQFDLTASRTVAFEALARWNSPQLGEVPPDIFIRAAERCGMINELTLCLLRKALLAAETWPEDLRLAFNLSARDIHSLPSVHRIRHLVMCSSVAPTCLEFEITETAMLGDLTQAQAGLALLKALGSRIALDDFGTGYSTFTYLQALPIDTLKIDRSFVAGLQKKPTRQIVKTLIDLCENLELDHVIEGVETEQELALIQAAGASCVQGYLFGKPMPQADIAAYLEAEKIRLTPPRLPRPEAGHSQAA
jgi:diguanylate cyclase (GGDEF)-like protein